MSPETHLIPANASPLMLGVMPTDKDRYSRLAAYRAILLGERGLAPASAAAHLSTIRGRYQALLGDNALRDALYAETPPDLGPADRKALVDELLARLENAIHPRQSSVPQITRQDSADSAHLHLTVAQVNQLLAAPGLDTRLGLCDTALIALLVCTGLREAEAVALQVEDLRQTLGGELAVYVRSGKGAKERLVPYGELSWFLQYVDAWRANAEATSGAVFRGLYKGGKSVRRTALTVRAVQAVLDRYPVIGGGTVTAARPHDPRRTYAAV